MGKVLIVGAGISGATLAQRFAECTDNEVLVIEKRDHIGGNCYDFINEDGILTPKYGPHYFHTNDEEVWEYVNRFSEWLPYEHRVLSNVDGNGTYVPIPVNIITVNKIFGLDINNEREMQRWLETNTEKIEYPKNSEEASLRRVGRGLYEKLFKKYTKKQWDMWPTELAPEVMDRIPVRINFDDRYFTDKYQALPKEGYTKLFEMILDHPQIEVRLNTTFNTHEIDLSTFEFIIYTGRIDMFFGEKINKPLQYRSLRFEFERHDVEFYQPAAQVNYPNTEAFTRITEPKHSTRQRINKTVIIKEYSTWEGEPYYPVPSEENQKLYAQYQNEAKKLEKENIYFVGRLAEYKYFNMDQAFKNALQYFRRLSVNK